MDTHSGTPWRSLRDIAGKCTGLHEHSLWPAPRCYVIGNGVHDAPTALGNYVGAIPAEAAEGGGWPAGPPGRTGRFDLVVQPRSEIQDPSIVRHAPYEYDRRAGRHGSLSWADNPIPTAPRPSTHPPPLGPFSPNIPTPVF